MCCVSIVTFLFPGLTFPSVIKSAMNKLRVILTFIHQSSIAKWMFIVRKKNKLSQDWIFTTVTTYPMSAFEGALITKPYTNRPEKITYDLSICYPYKRDCFST